MVRRQGQLYISLKLFFKLFEITHPRFYILLRIKTILDAEVLGCSRHQLHQPPGTAVGFGSSRNGGAEYDGADDSSAMSRPRRIPAGTWGAGKCGAGILPAAFIPEGKMGTTDFTD